MSSVQEFHSISDLESGDMEPSQFADNIVKGKRSKRSRPPFSVLTASEEEQGFSSSLSEISLQEEEEEEEEKQYLAHTWKATAQSLIMLACAHTCKATVGTVKPVLPPKRKMKKPEEFDEADSPYVFQFEVVKGEGERRYKCKTCSKKFCSFQALGGHRASCHTKYKSLHNDTTHDDGVATFLHTSSSSSSKQSEKANVIEKVKIHECPICYRVFTSGQALGGHKRSHNTVPSNTALEAYTSISTTDDSRSPQRLAKAEVQLDLNMPPPEFDCTETEESVWPRYAEANCNFRPYWWIESSGKRVPSVYDSRHNGVVVSREQYEADSKAVGRDLEFKPDLFLVAPVN